MEGLCLPNQSKEREREKRRTQDPFGIDTKVRGVWALSTLPMNHYDDCKNEISTKESGNVRSIHFIFGVKHSLIFDLICT